MFSVIIPCFNDVPLLAKTLAGFANQELGDGLAFEVLLVDNNSDPAGMADLYRRYYDRLDLYLLHQPKLPSTYALCRARNTGMRLARFPWIVSVDSDCIPHRRFLQNLRQALPAEERVMATGERVFVSSSGHDDAAILADPGLVERLPLVASVSNYNLVKDRRFPQIERLAECAHPWAYMHGGNTIFSRAAALEIGGYNEDYDGYWGYEDIEFAYRMITGARCRPLYLREIELYHQEPEQTVAPQRFNKRQNPNWLRICDEIPGFREYKEREYRKINAGEIVL